MSVYVSNITSEGRAINEIVNALLELKKRLDTTDDTATALSSTVDGIDDVPKVYHDSGSADKTSNTTLLTIAVPAGTYLITGSVTFKTTGTVQVELRADGSAFRTSESHTGYGSVEGLTVHLSEIHVAAAAESISLYASISSATAYDYHLTALLCQQMN